MEIERQRDRSKAFPLRRTFIAAVLTVASFAGGAYAAHGNSDELLALASARGVTAAVSPVTVQPPGKKRWTIPE